jgi:hypothetical protein
MLINLDNTSSIDVGLRSDEEQETEGKSSGHGRLNQVMNKI